MRGLIKVWGQGKVPILEADKGYDSEQTRLDVLSHEIFPLIARKKRSKGYKIQGICRLEKQRWVVGRTISWLKMLVVLQKEEQHIGMDR